MKDATRTETACTGLCTTYKESVQRQRRELVEVHQSKRGQETTRESGACVDTRKMALLTLRTRWTTADPPWGQLDENGVEEFDDDDDEASLVFGLYCESTHSKCLPERGLPWQLSTEPQCFLAA